ncbi:MAG: ABC transporter ATP-binding protein [Hyphomicrobiales bacterium]|nr:ABC transporter ATP-binding protein [Hyphomicrobiales bacterium]
MNQLEARNICLSFGSVRVTDNVSMTFESGSRYAIIGPNGAGKTTFFNLLAGNLRPDSGRIFAGGIDITAKDPTSRARIGIARSFQRNNLFNELSVRENLAIACALQERTAWSFWRPLARYSAVYTEADRIAEQVGLQDDLATQVRHLSYGSQRQLEVALALACRPKFLLLDEPTSGMSPQETAAMDRLINDLPRELAIIVIEHDMDIVLDFAERITVLDYGRILDQGSPEHIRNSEIVRERYLGGTLQDVAGGQV